MKLITEATLSKDKATNYKNALEYKNYAKTALKNQSLHTTCHPFPKSPILGLIEEQVGEQVGKFTK